MGEARRRAQAREQMNNSIAQADIPRLAAAIRKLTAAASSHVGSDCYIHAALGQAILARLGVETTIVAGYAAFRVGNGSGDVILHAPNSGMIPQPGALAYHVWLELNGNKLLDLTMH